MTVPDPGNGGPQRDEPPRSPGENAKTAVRWILGCAGALLLLYLILAALFVWLRPIIKG